MTTPAPAPAVTASPAKPASAPPAAALWRALCSLAVLIDPRLTDPAADPGAIVNAALCHGNLDQADADAIRAWLATRQE